MTFFKVYYIHTSTYARIFKRLFGISSQFEDKPNELTVAITHNTIFVVFFAVISRLEQFTKSRTRDVS